MPDSAASVLPEAVEHVLDRLGVGVAGVSVRVAAVAVRVAVSRVDDVVELLALGPGVVVSVAGGPSDLLVAGLVVPHDACCFVSMFTVVPMGEKLWKAYL